MDRLKQKKGLPKHIRDLYAQTTEAITTRENNDEAWLAKTELVINGVRADPTEGPNSALYEAMGHTRKSERKSGLSRKKTPPSKP